MIKEGIEFRIPCSSVKKEDPEEELLPRIERNEGAVYWLQPKGGTDERLVDGTCDAHDGRVRHTVCSCFCVSFLCGAW
jgi:hypothetical protein